MDFGIAIAPTPDSWRVVKRAEELGFTHAWFYDSPVLYADPFATMTLAARETSAIKLGPGMLVPSNRLAPVAAQSLASLSAFAPGRVVLGVGTGFTARSTMGQGPLSLGTTRRYVEVVQGLLRGETMDIGAADGERLTRFLAPAPDHLNLDDHVPLHFSAFGPRGQALTAEIAEGWCFLSGIVDLALEQAESVAGACREAERDPRDLYKTLFTLGCVLEQDESPASPRAVAQAGPLAAVYWHGWAEGSLPMAPPGATDEMLAGYQDLYASYGPERERHLRLHEGHLTAVRDEEAPFVTAEVLQAATFTGRPEELLERIEALADAGYDQLCVQLVPGQEAALEDWAALAREGRGGS